MCCLLVKHEWGLGMQADGTNRRLVYREEQRSQDNAASLFFSSGV